MDITSISAALSSIKIALDMINGAKNINTQSEFRDKISELHSVISSISSDIISAHSEIQKMYDENSNLRSKLKQYENWSRDKAKYEPKIFAPNTTVYTIKKPKNPTEEKLRFCAKCFNDMKAIPLHQKNAQWVLDNFHICPNCNNEYPINSEEPIK